MCQMPSVAIGVVKGFDDPAGEGRLEVEFPWLPEGNRSAMAAIAAPLAGKERGLFFMPEPEDEVLLAFDHGDFDHPYIVGFLWNGVDKPPRDSASTRVLVTPGRHMLEFEDDEQTGRRITLRSAGGHTVEIDDRAGSVAVSTSSGQQIVLRDTPGSIELRGGGRRLALENRMVVIT
jgi:uncharacterized protein involved in type VI secretion and phage assembly